MKLLGPYTIFLVIELLLEAGRFTRALAHEVQLGAVDNAMAFDHDLVDARGAEQESTLHTDTVGSHAADGDGLVVAALAGADDSALELLDTFAFTFLDLDVHADIVTGTDLGNVFVLFGLESLDDICHCLSSLLFDVVSFLERRQIIARLF